MSQLDLIEGTTRNVELSQYFTPPKLAQKVVDWAGVDSYTRPDGGLRGLRVLEPSAGNGALVRPLVAAGADVTSVELDRRYHDDVVLLNPSGRTISNVNFLECDKFFLREFDLCVMNCPYHDDLESKFILHALEFAPRVVGIFRADLFYTVTRGDTLWKRVRPTRVAFCSRRPWKGAETDYCVLELVKHPGHCGSPSIKLEWWNDKWF